MSAQGQPLRIELAGERVELWPERALHWPAAHTLIVADLHWGKATTFRRWGVPVPGGVLIDELVRLDQLVRATRAQRIVVLGDLIHGAEGISRRVESLIEEWRRDFGGELVLVEGNHDQHMARLPSGWRVRVVDELLAGPFLFVHEPQPARGHYVLGGHEHPVARLSGGGDSLRLPCFRLGPELGVLPAFHHFTGGGAVPRRRDERVYGLAEGRVVRLW